MYGQQNIQSSMKTLGKGYGIRRLLLPGASWIGLFVVVLGLFSPVSASAKDSGTWFIAEMHHGVGMPTGFGQDGLGYSLRGVFGVGGRIPATPLRCQALLSVGYGGFSDTTVAAFTAAQLERAMVDVGAGVRLMVPIIGRLRIYSDVLFGYGHVLTHLSLGRLENYDTSTGGFAMTFAGGFQYRFARFISLGFRGEWTGVLRADPVDFATAVLARPQSNSAFQGRHAYFMSATFHF